MVIRTTWQAVTVACEELSQFSKPEDTVKFFREKIGMLDHEEFWVALLNSKNKVIDAQMISKGSLTGTVVHPREVFAPAIVGKASAIIVAHNHPSCDPLPSKEDKTITKQLVKSGIIIGIPVLDHIIVGGNEYYSFQEAGEMKGDD